MMIPSSETFPCTALLIAALTLGGCERGPGPMKDTGEAPGCAAGWLADQGECVPEACGMGRWGQLEVDDSTVYVDSGAGPGGDGCEERSLSSIQAGLDLWGSRGGGLVAVAAGTYPESLVLAELESCSTCAPAWLRRTKTSVQDQMVSYSRPPRYAW